MIVTKSLDNMIANEEASAFTDSKVNKSNGFDSSETSEIINDTSSTISTEEHTPLKKLEVAENKNVSKNGEILPKEKNEDIIKNGDDDNECLGKKSEDEKIATKNSEILIETEKETTPQQNSVEKKESNEKEKTTSSPNESKIDASKVDDKQSMEEDSKMDVDNDDNTKKESIKEQNEAKNSEKIVEEMDTHPEEEKNNSENKKGAISLEPATQSDSESQGTADSEAEDETKKEEKKSEDTVKHNAPPLSTPPSVDYNKGLEELTNIANCGKNINEEDGQKKITSKFSFILLLYAG